MKIAIIIAVCVALFIVLKPLRKPILTFTVILAFIVGF